jgi:hypothetical protein
VRVVCVSCRVCVCVSCFSGCIPADVVLDGGLVGTEVGGLVGRRQIAQKARQRPAHQRVVGHQRVERHVLPANAPRTRLTTFSVVARSGELCVVCRVPCAVCRVSCVVCRVSCAVCRVSCVVCRVPCAVCRVPCAVCRVSCVVCRVSCVVCRVSCVVCRVSCVVCRVSCVCAWCACATWGRRVRAGPFPIGGWRLAGC